jgi:hypothetical protein
MRGALLAGAALAGPGAVVAWWLRGPRGSLAVVAAVGLVVGNMAASWAVLHLARRRFPAGFPAVALPSYVVRMALVFLAMAALHGAPVVDRVVFSVAFPSALLAVLAVECALWARAPWLAIELGGEAP